ncbi:FkbM family methyltransferase [Luteolibacter flavescens]|uniref:FkbM family methyltransferase n=1 Tax=Luteolibacter flavescens TaxID=1859460 RepID=A0ABT3FV73_9BACT|nr:FkbM family methyltransferase [Luteolibacter flavescens]MCW1887317.1 FkbM family methyltransferase [Luteolibacter flavescens]
MKQTVQNLKWLSSHPLTRQRPFTTWGRWFYWQARQLVTSKPKIASFPGGLKLAIHPHEGLTGYWYVGLDFDFDEFQFLSRYLRPGELFYDVGSNAGVYACYAASLACKVVAFEPIPKAFRRLEENIFLNGFRDIVSAVNMAVGACPGSLNMTLDNGTGNRVVADGEATEKLIEVKVTTIDEAASEQAPEFMKIDVEGFEWEVAQGARSTLRSPRLQALLIETFRSHNWQLERLRKLEDELAACGFHPFEYEAEGNTLRRLHDKAEGGNNTLYLKSEEFVLQRLTETRSSQAGQAP